MNPLLRFLDASKPLIYKWTHYFEIYHRHFRRYRNHEVTVLEIGVYQGGSLEMWRDYFGPRARIIGVDIDPRCQAAQQDQIEVFIGDQSNRAFLQELKQKLPHVDIIIDDGSHIVGDQIITFEELFPHLHETGVYLCEDLHTSYWEEYGGDYRSPSTFIEFSKRLIDELNAWHGRDAERHPVTPFTSSASSMHFYDSVLVIEKHPRQRPQNQKQGYLRWD